MSHTFGYNFARGIGRAVNFRLAMTATVSALALLAVTPAFIASSARASDASNTDEGKAPIQTAQAASAASRQSAATQAPIVEEVVVTGSRIVRDGYEAPTPVSVLSAEDLQQNATTNISDAVNRMPAFAGSTTTHNSSVLISAASAGLNNLNLRGLGPNRTLVLLDGQRVVAGTIQGFSNNGGAVDVNIIPTGLLSRVDVVTGGASAAYGSDALAGVVNFVLDHNFTGIKGEVQGGVTTYGDDETYKLSLTGGTAFADNKGHFLLFGEQQYNAGISGIPRPWIAPGAQILSNPAYTATNGQPQFITRTSVGLATALPGGLITSGPLKGTAFGPNGGMYPFQYGSLLSGVEMVGGAWQTSRFDPTIDLDMRLVTQTAFSRVSYDIADDIEVYGEFGWGDARSKVGSVPNFRQAVTPITILSGNPFIPASIQAQMTTLGLASIPVGTLWGDVGHIVIDSRRIFRRFAGGADGKFDAFDSSWTWKAYYQNSSEHISSKNYHDLITPNYQAAIDAVRASNGSIICRSTLTNPSNGCVPFNPFGTGVNSQAAINYISGTDQTNIVLKEDSAGFNTSGEPFSDWAGPVSLALGLEWRRESVGGVVPSPFDVNNQWFAGNFHATIGHYTVTEGFVETVVPLAKDESWAKSLDLNGSVRATSYSTSGYVTTWKVGATWTPIDDLRFRATRSRDIRAPNLGELFNAGQGQSGTLFDRFNNNASVNSFQLTIGNPNLKPEVADTTGVGVVVQPSFLPGFTAAADYYSIDISGAIRALTPQQYVDYCFDGQQSACAAITRTNGVISQILIQPINIQSQTVHGLDLEASYKLALSDINSGWNGDLMFRGLGTYVFTLKSIQNGVVTEGAGVNTFGLNTAPRFHYTLSATYSNDPITSTLTIRGVSAGKYKNEYVVCSSGCPTSTTAAPTIDFNHYNAIAYFDLSLAYKFVVADQANAEAFLTVENLLNQDPPFAYGDPNGGFYGGPSNASYDRIGRYFHAGIRFKM